MFGTRGVKITEFKPKPGRAHGSGNHTRKTTVSSRSINSSAGNRQHFTATDPSKLVPVLSREDYRAGSKGRYAVRDRKGNVMVMLGSISQAISYSRSVKGSTIDVL